MIPMKFKNKYRIEPNRWQYWDYSAPGDYYITINTLGRKCIFGIIKNKKAILSKCGEIVKSEFLQINNYHHRAKLREYIIMPNHVHCIITLTDYENHDVVGNGDIEHDVDVVKNDIVKKIHVKKIHEFSLYDPSQNPSTSQQQQNHALSINEIKQYRKLRRNMVLIKILGKFKQQTSKKINIERNTIGNKNWQHDFYDHVIRNKQSYQGISNYIINNPKNWNKDKFYE